MNLDSHRQREMIRIMDEAISMLRCGETDAEVFGVDYNGVADDVVLILIRGEDWPRFKPIIDALGEGGTQVFEEHDLGNPEDN